LKPIQCTEDEKISMKHMHGSQVSALAYCAT
jgi:hypothetical protein